MHVKKTDGSYAIGVDLGEIIKNNYPLLSFWTPEYLDPDVAAEVDPLWRRMRISYYGGDESGIRVLWNPDVANLHLLFYNYYGIICNRNFIKKGFFFYGYI